MSSRIPGGFSDFLLLRLLFQITEPDILIGGCVIADRLLEKDRDQFSKINQIYGSQVTSIEFDASAIRIIKATEQLHKGALPCSVRPDNCSDLAGRNFEMKVIESDPVASR